jgi:hypothetical protein
MLLSALRSAWHRLPKGMHLTAKRIGLRYVAHFLLHYSEVHKLANFSGNLEQLKIAYRESSVETKKELLRRFDAIVDGLAMPNGVKKNDVRQSARTRRIHRTICDPPTML